MIIEKIENLKRAIVSIPTMQADFQYWKKEIF